MTDRRILFSGEMQLARWSDSSTQGATVTFWVHPEDLESFKLLKARAGKQAGQRIGCVMVEINDDEAVVEQPEQTAKPNAGAASGTEAAPGAAIHTRRYHPPSIGDNGLLAVRWCKDAEFQRWIADQWGDSRPASEADAKAHILHMCGLVEKHGQAASRKHLDTDPEAAAAFHEHIRIPFRDHLREKGIQR
jgi:hypothetical protein